MEKIYQNDYGVSYKNFGNKKEEKGVQLMIDRVGLYLSMKELENLKKLFKIKLKVNLVCARSVRAQFLIKFGAQIH